MVNTFVVVDCKKRKSIMVTQSARKAKLELDIGTKIEIWKDGVLIEIIYARASKSIDKYVSLEKKYIREKQAKAEQRNKRQRNRHNAINK
jgi:transposase